MSSRPRLPRSPRLDQPDRQLFYAVVAFIVLTLLVGGERPGKLLPFVIIGLAGSWLTLVAVARGALRQFGALPVAARLLLCGLVLLPAAQLIPLPPALWRGLAGRDLVVQVLDAAALGNDWRPLTTSVADTFQAWLYFLWCAVLILAVLALPKARIRLLLVVFFVLIALHLAIGIVQLASHGELLDIYDTSQGRFLTGLFANKNHSGLFIATAFLLGAALLPRDPAARRRMLLVGTPFVIIVVVGLFASYSRAAILLGALAAALALLGVADGKRTLPVRSLAIGVAMLALVVVAVSTSDLAGSLLDRFDDIRGESRWTIWQRCWPLVRAYFPWGAGISTFAPLFASIEQLGWVKPTYLNNVHNDYIEIVIEAGVGGIVLLLVAFWTWIAATWQAWRFRARTEGRHALVAAAVVLLFAIHSGFDYPLRRIGLAAMFCTMLAILLRGARCGTFPIVRGSADG